jgi:hypothetical protein
LKALISGLLIGKAKVKSQRSKVERQRLLHDFEIHNQADPQISVATVKGRPIRRYSRKPTCTPSAAARSQQHHGRHVAHQIRNERSKRHENGNGVKIPHCDWLKQAVRQSRAFRARHNDAGDVGGAS